MPRAPLLLPLPLLLAACASPPPATPDLAAETVTVTTRGLTPSATVRVPRFGAVVFRNADPAAAFTVTVDRPLAPTKACSTTLGFHELGDQGERTATQPLPPHGIASLCFHDEGTFAFHVEGSGQRFDGSIVVGGAQ